ncbi:hypothetical protein PIN31009_05537 [Pandoraea iniqua]|uniref:glycosyl hydrolase family 28-related protein n=1 Tax=Pandoraea iniqua TaxID=2508288 RepID=UPI0012425C85|nr:glycosyl hydrolase family 28-related protein [Pandoraea iniqua]VVE59454.1 hypothetical protein PIN31009_05537 [Pandoraea iniqua]
MGANLTNPVPIFIDLDGNPLNGGFIYVGVADTDPMTNPVSVYQDVERTIAMTQPLRTIDGMVAVNGKAKQVFVGANSFSLAVFDKQGRLVISLPHGEDGVLISLAAPDGVTLVGGAPRVANSVVDLRTFPKTANPFAIVTSYWGDGNGGSGTFRRDLTDTTSADNGGTIIVANDGCRWKLCQESPVSVKQFGAKGDGTTDDTDRFKLALAWAASLGGARIFVPAGVYVLTNFEIDQPRVIFEGDTGGTTYEKIPDLTTIKTRLIPSASAVWVMRLKGTSTGAAAQGSGFRNILITDSGATVHDYGLIVDSAETIAEDSTVQGFKFGGVIPAAGNNNVFRRVAFTGAASMGFLVSEHQAKTYMHPNVPDIPEIPSTLWQMSECVIRQNEFGAMLRDGIGASLGDTVIESNRQSGLYVYRTDVSTVRDITFDHVHFENNYDGYAGDPTGYSVAGNRAFLIGNASTYLAWSNTLQVAYQVVLDSQTHGGTGGSDTLDFPRCAINCNSIYQRAILGLSGTKPKFDTLNLGGSGDTDNLIRMTSDVNGALFVDPIPGNDPTGIVPCLAANNGANLGTRGIYLRTGSRSGDLGAIYPQVGAFGGPIHFLGQVTGDPRNADARMLDDYFETLFAGLWRTDGATPFNVLSETSYFTKIGRFVKVQCRVTVQVSATTSTPQTLYLAGGLPQGAENSGFLVGQTFVSALSGATPVVNNGRTSTITNTTTTIIGLDPVFPALTLGHQYLITLDASYITKT